MLISVAILKCFNNKWVFNREVDIDNYFYSIRWYKSTKHILAYSLLLNSSVKKYTILL